VGVAVDLLAQHLLGAGEGDRDHLAAQLLARLGDLAVDLRLSRLLDAFGFAASGLLRFLDDLVGALLRVVDDLGGLALRLAQGLVGTLACELLLVFAALGGWLLLGQTVTATAVAGFACIFAGFVAAKYPAIRAELRRLDAATR